MKTLLFTMDPQLLIGDETVECGPEEYRVVFEEHPGSSVSVLYCECNETRHGKPEIWARCGMPSGIKRQLERWIEDKRSEEERAMVASYDAARWRETA